MTTQARHNLLQAMGEKMSDKILNKCEVCADCGEKMSAGETFRWYAVQMAYGRKVGSYKTVWKKAHKDKYCGAKKFEKMRVSEQIEELNATILSLTEMIRVSAVGEEKNALLESVVSDMRSEIQTLSTKLEEIDLW